MSVEQRTRSAQVFDGTGNQAGEVELDEAVFGGPINQALLHQALLRQQANQRQGTHQTKTRGEVSGGGKKPWRQKGTGRARQGSTRAPQWRHGGTVFGPHPRSYEQDLPKKQRRLALRAALASKADAEQLRVVEEIALEAPKTKTMAELFGKISAGDRTLFVIPEHDLNLEKSVRNLATVKTILVSNLNVSDVMTADSVVFTRGALDQLGEWLS
jgi:large subunit ribosomal protein L4